MKFHSTSIRVTIIKKRMTNGMGWIVSTSKHTLKFENSMLCNMNFWDQALCRCSQTNMKIIILVLNARLKLPLKKKQKEIN